MIDDNNNNNGNSPGSFLLLKRLVNFLLDQMRYRFLQRKQNFGSHCIYILRSLTLLLESNHIHQTELPESDSLTEHNKITQIQNPKYGINSHKKYKV